MHRGLTPAEVSGLRQIEFKTTEPSLCPGLWGLREYESGRDEEDST